MKVVWLSACVAVGLGLLGCASVPPYTRLDLKQNLSSETLARFQRESKDAAACCPGARMVQLERSNWWPVGLLAYWWQGSAMRTEVAPGEPSYMVQNSQGYGPISILYVTSTHSTYNGQGQRVSSMTSGNVLLGHLAMLHRSENVLPDGRTQEVRMYHLFHHLLNIHTMDGHTNVSLFTSPNPLGVSFPGGGIETP
jgi:hypothetical protein